MEGRQHAQAQSPAAPSAPSTPCRLRSRSLTLLLGSQVRSPARRGCASMNWGRSALSSALKNRRPVQNHIKVSMPRRWPCSPSRPAASGRNERTGRQAAADQDHEIDYLKRAQGDLAIATLEAGQIEQIRQQDKRGPRGGVGQRRERQPADRLRDGLGLGRQETPGRYRRPQVAHLRQSDYICAAANRRKPASAPSHPSRQPRAQPQARRSRVAMVQEENRHAPARKIFPV